MKKIPSLFIRTPEDMSRLTTEVHPDCSWVVAGEGVATRKYDGTCCMFDGSTWWARREVRPGKDAPEGYLPIETDPVTGKTFGWEPIGQSAYKKFWQEAVNLDLLPGTYELVGPKVQSNPEGLEHHQLIRHADAEVLPGVPLDFDGLKDWLHLCPFEGVVWHHPDGRMAKLKRRDFR